MSWKYDITLPASLPMVRAYLLAQMEKALIPVRENESGVLEIHPTRNFLFAKHPLELVSSGEIRLEKVNEQETRLYFSFNPSTLRIFCLVVPVISILAMTWMLTLVFQTGWWVIIKGYWSFDVCVLGGVLLIYLLIKQAIWRYIKSLVKGIQLIL